MILKSQKLLSQSTTTYQVNTPQTTVAIAASLVPSQHSRRQGSSSNSRLQNAVPRVGPAQSQQNTPSYHKK